MPRKSPARPQPWPPRSPSLCGLGVGHLCFERAAGSAMFVLAGAGGVGHLCLLTSHPPLIPVGPVEEEVLLFASCFLIYFPGGQRSPPRVAIEAAGRGSPALIPSCRSKVACSSPWKRPGGKSRPLISGAGSLLAKPVSLIYFLTIKGHRGNGRRGVPPLTPFIGRVPSFVSHLLPGKGSPAF